MTIDDVRREIADMLARDTIGAEQMDAQVSAALNALGPPMTLCLSHYWEQEIVQSTVRYLGKKHLRTEFLGEGHDAP